MFFLQCCDKLMVGYLESPLEDACHLILDKEVVLMELYYLIMSGFLSVLALCMSISTQFNFISASYGPCAIQYSS